MKCAADASETCGGGWANQVYDVSGHSGKAISCNYGFKAYPAYSYQPVLSRIDARSLRFTSCALTTQPHMHSNIIKFELSI